MELKERNGIPYIQTGRLSQIPILEEILTSELEVPEHFGDGQNQILS